MGPDLLRHLCSQVLRFGAQSDPPLAQIPPSLSLSPAFREMVTQLTFISLHFTTMPLSLTKIGYTSPCMIHTSAHRTHYAPCRSYVHAIRNQQKGKSTSCPGPIQNVLGKYSVFVTYNMNEVLHFQIMVHGYDAHHTSILFMTEHVPSISFILNIHNSSSVSYGIT